MPRMILILSLLIFAGCREVSFEGVMEVAEPFLVKNSDLEMVQLERGAYELNLKASSRKLVAQVTTSNSGKLVFELLMPKDVQIPENGSVFLESEVTGQNFDLLANITTDFSDSSAIDAFEDCRTQRWETVCTPNGCFERLVDVWGRRRVSFKNRTFTRALETELLAKGTDQILATSQSTNSEVQRVYLFEGHCF